MAKDTKGTLKAATWTTLPMRRLACARCAQATWHNPKSPKSGTAWRCTKCRMEQA